MSVYILSDFILYTTTLTFSAAGSGSTLEVTCLLIIGPSRLRNIAFSYSRIPTSYISIEFFQNPWIMLYASCSVIRLCYRRIAACRIDQRFVCSDYIQSTRDLCSASTSSVTNRYNPRYLVRPWTTALLLEALISATTILSDLLR